jgi:hypothetical protein
VSDRPAKKRSMSIQVDMVEVKKGWGSSSLLVEQCARNGVPGRKVRISIPDPSTLEYLRDRLNEISEHWAAELKRCPNVEVA